VEPSRYLSLSAEELQDHLVAAYGAAEATYERIERALHNGPEQRLVSVALDLRLLESTLASEDTAREQLVDLSAQLTDIASDMRTLGRDLFPAIVSEAGVQAGIRALARRAPMVVISDAEGAERYERPVELAVYRAVAELIRYYAHIGSTEVVVRLNRAGDDLMLDVRPRDGRFQPDVDPIDPAARAQIAAVKGTVEILPSPIGPPNVAISIKIRPRG
jgi:signal transduction histidine kinase